MLPEENTHERPSWSSWKHIEAKRRATMTLYLMSWCYAVHHGLPSYDCRELNLVPGTAARFLWQARSKEEWEKLYLKWLCSWNGREFMQWELCSISPGLGLDDRAEQWLEDADEFGIMLLSVSKSLP